MNWCQQYLNFIFLLLLFLGPSPLLLSRAEVVFLHIHKGAGTFVCHDVVQAQRNNANVSLAPLQPSSNAPQSST